jgi:hypothetical protein
MASVMEHQGEVQNHLGRRPARNAVHSLRILHIQAFGPRVRAYSVDASVNAPGRLGQSGLSSDGFVPRSKHHPEHLTVGSNRTREPIVDGRTFMIANGFCAILSCRNGSRPSPRRHPRGRTVRRWADHTVVRLAATLVAPQRNSSAQLPKLRNQLRTRPKPTGRPAEQACGRVNFSTLPRDWYESC